MARKRFYVVIHGRQPGIYQEWSGEEGAAEQVEGVDEAIFKGFETIEEAVEWIRGFDRETLLRLAPDLLDLVDRRSSGQQAKSPEDWLRAGSVVIYTHGAVIALRTWVVMAWSFASGTIGKSCRAVLVGRATVAWN